MLTLEEYESVVEEALNHMHEARTQQSLAAWQHALSLLDRNLEDWEFEASCIQVNMATCHLRLGDYAACLHLCEGVLELYQAEDYLDSDEAQRVLALMVDAYVGSGELELASGTSALALATVRKNVCEYQPSTVAIIARQRAEVARLRETPDEAEGALAYALGYLNKLGQTEPDLLRLKAELLESRAKNREQGMVLDLAESDLATALRLYEKLDGRDSESVQRVRTQLGHLLLRSLEL